MSLYNYFRVIQFKWFRFKTIFWYKYFFNELGNYCIILKPTIITPKFISCGNNVFIGWRARIEGVDIYQNINFSPKIVLHDGVTIQQNIHLTCAEFVEIGKNTAIAANVTITDIHHPYEDIHVAIEQQPITTKKVVIGEDCKIYNNSVIMQGTIIGKHSTVGANSVVSGEFRDYSVIVGSPAKTIKRYSFEKNAWLKTDANGNFIEI